ncbi:NUDIX domain-containing protein [Ochrovirga pacifica]|uniref:NUDIX domain-containing protein n=1 Tax=Ochrovirga pacifica TaxID=1042376 RepID=UPI0002F46864|nr:NUDIX domain-containing protein [Ochrovirga pacifica]
MKTPLNILSKELLSNDYYTLHKVNYQFINQNGVWEKASRESYDKGNGTTILLYNTTTQKIILTKQLRIPTHFNGNPGGMLLEACAGGVEGAESPESAILRETEEETGYRVPKVQQIFQAYMSPGSVTEILYFFIAPYNEYMKVGSGGGLIEENENITVVELDFNEAYKMIGHEIIDAKTIMLLQYLKIHKLMS